MSSSLAMATVAGIVLFTGGLGIINIGLIGLAALPVIAVLIMRKQYMIERLVSYAGSLFSGEPLNYQSAQSLIGFGRGGLLGVGLGQSKQKMLFLPEPHTDFIYSIVGEEGGLIAAAVILFAFLVLFISGVKIVTRQHDSFNALLGAGLVGSIILYAFVNMGVAVGLLPVTGLPLPFISSGGTSLVVSLWSVGVLRKIHDSSG